MTLRRGDLTSCSGDPSALEEENVRGEKGQKGMETASEGQTRLAISVIPGKYTHPHPHVGMGHTLLKGKGEKRVEKGISAAEPRGLFLQGGRFRNRCRSMGSRDLHEKS